MSELKAVVNNESVQEPLLTNKQKEVATKGDLLAEYDLLLADCITLSVMTETTKWQELYKNIQTLIKEHETVKVDNVDNMKVINHHVSAKETLKNIPYSITEPIRKIQEFMKRWEIASEHFTSTVSWNSEIGTVVIRHR